MLQLCQLAFKAVVTVTITVATIFFTFLFSFFFLPGLATFLHAMRLENGYFFFGEGVTGFFRKSLLAARLYSFVVASSEQISAFGEKKVCKLHWKCYVWSRGRGIGRKEPQEVVDGVLQHTILVEVNQHGNLIHKLWEKPSKVFQVFFSFLSSQGITAPSAP